MTIGERLREYRIYRGLTQAEVAARLGISAQALSSWEKDRNRPNPEDLVGLSKIYEISIDSLLGNVLKPVAFLSEKLTPNEMNRIVQTALNGMEEEDLKRNMAYHRASREIKNIVDTCLLPYMFETKENAKEKGRD